MRIVTTGVVLAALSLAANVARADDKAAAEAEFLKGRKLMKEGKVAQACEAFAASVKLDAQNGTNYNLALCYEQQGKIASAWSIYRDLAQRDTNATRKKDSGKRAAVLEPKLTKLLITTRNGTPGLHVSRGDADVTNLLGIEDPIDPGRYHIVATAEGRKPWESDVEVQPGAGATITVDIPPLEIDPNAAKPDAPDQQVDEPLPDDELPPEPASGGTRKIIGFSVGGAGVLAVGAGLFFGYQAKSTWSDVDALCGSDHVCPQEHYAEGQELTKDARLQANLSTILVGAGAVAVAAGVYLVLTAPDGDSREHHDDETALRLVPQVGGDGVGVLATGAF